MISIGTRSVALTESDTSFGPTKTGGRVSQTIANRIALFQSGLSESQTSFDRKYNLSAQSSLLDASHPMIQTASKTNVVPLIPRQLQFTKKKGPDLTKSLNSFGLKLAKKMLASQSIYAFGFSF